MVTKARVQIDGEWYRLKKNGKPGIKLTRCAGTQSEAEFKGWVLSGLRDRTRYWKPAAMAWKLHTRPNQSGSRHKLEHQCAHCKKWFVKKKEGKRNTIELDHIIPCGGLNDFSKSETWINKAFVEVGGYQKLCIACHSRKTDTERGA